METSDRCLGFALGKRRKELFDDCGVMDGAGCHAVVPPDVVAVPNTSASELPIGGPGRQTIEDQLGARRLHIVGHPTYCSRAASFREHRRSETRIAMNRNDSRAERLPRFCRCLVVIEPKYRA